VDEHVHDHASPGDPSAVGVLISLVASAASVALAFSADGAWERVSAHPWVFLTFLGVTFALQLASVEIYGRGAFSFAGAGMLAMGLAFGPGPAMYTAVGMGLLNTIRRGGKLHRAVFDMAQWGLAAGAAAVVYAAFGPERWSTFARFVPATIAGIAFLVVNIGLLCVAMSLSEGTSPIAVWRERFKWITPYYLTSGPLALALVIAYHKVGLTGLVAFALPPAFMMISIRQYLTKTRASVEEVRQANEELRRANEDLHALFQFAGGLAARAHNRNELVTYAERTLGSMTGGRARVFADAESGEIELNAAGSHVGSLQMAGSSHFDEERWERLRDAVVPQLATALESVSLIEEVHKKHLATIAVLSRSMEAKDDYTGGHTERVSGVAVAVARRLGYSGSDLDAVEVGALLHDIGKIGIPERILHKPGPLDEDEWKVMREHPVISEHILSGIDLSPLVLQIARSSHERMDGMGYPDGLKSEAIPLPARIVLVSDAFDALTSDRPYRRGRSVYAALEEIRAHAGTQFCPRVVAALEDVYREEPQVLGAVHLRAVPAVESAA
jgi:putative nucleotidyltransferase with HDIG domain